LKLLSFDIEIFSDLDDSLKGIDLYKSIIPSIAAIGTCNDDVQYFYDIPHMTVDTAKNLVYKMVEYTEQGYFLYGWNLVKFDIPVLAYFTGLFEILGKLALESIDPMAIVTFNKGYYLSLNSSLVGAGVSEKVHEVILNDGSHLEKMSGMLAPTLWRSGEIEAVKTYLHGDITAPLELATAIEKNNGIKWFSKTGKPMFVKSELLQFKDLFTIRTPNNSWMDNPPQRKDFINWIPENVLSEYGIYLDYV
jgi:hypothetical protein